MATPSCLTTDKQRATATHVFFWGGDLSNWNTSGPGFSGRRCFELLIPELDALGIDHPDLKSYASKMLSAHKFNCGEQWMMAMKGWFFERDLELGEWIVPATEEDQFQKSRRDMYATRAPKTMAAGSKEALMWESTICKVLREKSPRKQKSLGRKAQGFQDKLWSDVNMACVIASCVARAEVEANLRKIYLLSGKRQFVEGSPFDTVWGVGLLWKERIIEDPQNWRGENRLGICHDRAALKIRDMVAVGTIRSDEVEQDDS